MPLSSERRQRILQARQLKQRGHSLRQIAEQLNISRATVHADLRLFDEAFPQIIQSLAHDHTLERLEYAAQQLRQLAAADPLEPLFKYTQIKDERAAPLVGQVAAPDIVRLYGQHRSVMIALLREHRLAAAKLESTGRSLDQDPQILDQAEQHLTESDHPSTPRPDTEAAPEPAAEQHSAEHPEHPEPLTPPEQSNPQPASQPSRAQRRRAEAAQRKARKKNLRKQRPAA